MNLTKDSYKLFQNFTALAFIRFLEFIIPLATFPYLVRVLGLNNYGIIQVAYYSKAFFLIFTEFGFSLTAVRDIALIDVNKINDSLNTLISLKILLLIIITPFYWLLYFFLIETNEVILYTFNYFHLISLTFNPLWFFRARQNVRVFSNYLILSNLVLIILIFIFITKETDYYLHIIFLVFSQISLILFAWWKIVKDFKFKFKFASYLEIYDEVKKYFEIFLATFVASSYTKLIPLILKLFLNDSVVAIYVAAEKIIRVFENIASVIHDSLFPYFTKLFNNTNAIIRKRIAQVTILIAVLLFIVSSIVYIFAESIVLIVLGDEFIGSTVILKILSILIFVKGIGHISLLQIMVNKLLNRDVLLIVSFAAILSILSGVILIPKIGVIGGAISALIPEIFVLFFSWYFVFKKKLI